MTSFVDALRKGFAAHDEYKAALQDVRTLLLRLEQQLREAVGEDIKVQWVTATKDQRNPAIHESVLGIKPPQEKYRAVELRFRGGRGELAELELDDKTGWPVSVTSGKQSFYCHSLNDLESAFLSILSSQRAGALFARLGVALPDDAPTSGEQVSRGVRITTHVPDEESASDRTITDEPGSTPEKG